MKLYEMLARKTKWKQEANAAYEAQAWGEKQCLIALLPASGGFNYETYVSMQPDGVMRIMTNYYISTVERGGLGTIEVDIMVKPSLVHGFDIEFIFSDMGKRIVDKLGLLEYFNDMWNDHLDRDIVEILTDDGWRDYKYDTEENRKLRDAQLLIHGKGDDND